MISMGNCKPCGRLLQRRFVIMVGNVIESVCWVCKVWAETGYIMPERR